MIRCTCWLGRAAAFLSRRSIGFVVLAVITIVHPLIHGLPIDGGALDSFIFNVQSWALLNVHAGTDET